jgi:hypothetical protein
MSINQAFMRLVGDTIGFDREKLLMDNNFRADGYYCPCEDFTPVILVLGDKETFQKGSGSGYWCQFCGAVRHAHVFDSQRKMFRWLAHIDDKMYMLWWEFGDWKKMTTGYYGLERRLGER